MVGADAGLVADAQADVEFYRGQEHTLEKLVGICVHGIAVPGLARSTMATTTVCDDSIPMVG